MSEAPTPRLATSADANQIASHRYPEAEDAAERPVYAEWVAGAMQRGTYLGWLVTESSQVIAGAGLTLLEWGPTRGQPNPLRARLVNVYTAPEWRRKGLARQLVETALREAAARNIGVVSLGTSPVARPLYLSLGFEESRTEMCLK
ncbi:GNAT family N-acetyltransferase [Deinococcus sp.]|uniref:GNAT family N-acetyltransferase n=1 Tax=Deinococcus sp. TaxID=47478 RepID=UPI003B58F5A0